jgi:hypothetical protein
VDPAFLSSPSLLQELLAANGIIAWAVHLEFCLVFIRCHKSYETEHSGFITGPWGHLLRQVEPPGGPGLLSVRLPSFLSSGAILHKEMYLGFYPWAVLSTQSLVERGNKVTVHAVQILWAPFSSGFYSDPSSENELLTMGRNRGDTKQGLAEGCKLTKSPLCFYAKMLQGKKMQFKKK